MEADIRARILEYIRDRILDGDSEGLDENSPLLEWGILNSLELVQFRVFMDEELGIRIPDERFTAENFATVTAIAALIEQERGPKKGA